MKIFVDADACPVKQLITELAMQNKVEVIMVSSSAHFSPYTTPEAHVQYVMVDAAQQSADLYIVNHIHKGDVVVTQDYGLAAMAVAKQTYAVHHSGFEFTDHNLDELMFRRHLSAKIRRAGGKTKGPRAFSVEDLKRFKELLASILQRRKI